MLLYYVQWERDKSLTKGKGRSKNSNHAFVFTVLCNNSSDAHRCLLWYFKHVFDKTCDYNIDDGLIRMSRMTIDSRSFYPQYLLLDGMREPIYLSDPLSNLTRADSIFGRYR